MKLGYRPARTKLQTLAKKREQMKTDLAEKIKANLKKRLDFPTKKFAATKEQDEARWKEWSDYTHAAETDLAKAVKEINAEQKKDVIGNLSNIIGKAIDKDKLFDIAKWIGVTAAAALPIIETLFEHQANEGAGEVGTSFTFSDTLKEAVKHSVQKMSESYQQTTIDALADHINEGLQNGESLADITKRVDQVYEWSDESRAATVAKTESFRAANSALKSAWQQSGVVKTVRWYTSGLDNVCDLCQSMDGKTISIDDNFFSEGDTLTVGEGDDAQSMTMDYGDVENPPLHCSCCCMIRPQDVSI